MSGALIKHTEDAARGAPWRFRLLAATLLLALLIPRMTQRGMFLDGITYAVVARNMAMSAGTFWKPFYTATVYPEFYEQLPLAMGLQSLAFRAFGDHFAVERVYSVTVFLLHALVIVGMWRLVLPARYDSLPLFFWVLPSVVTWAVINNALENTQALLTSLGVLCLLLGVRQARTSAVVAWGALGGIGVVAAVLAKGPVGLFPLAVPPLLLIVMRVPISRVAVLWAAQIAIVSAAAVAVLAFDRPQHAITEWARSHLMPALEGQRGDVWTAVDLWRHLTMGICGRLMVLAAIFWAIFWKRFRHFRIESAAVFFLLVGLIASVPVLISAVMAGMYFMPAVPYFALGFAALALPAVEREPAAAPSRWQHVPIAIALALVITSAAVIVTRGSLERRDTSLIRDLDAIAPVVPAGATIGTCSNAAGDWGFHAYMQRFFRVSLQAGNAPANGWLLVHADDCVAPDTCRTAAAGDRLRLYRCDLR